MPELRSSVAFCELADTDWRLPKRILSTLQLIHQPRARLYQSGAGATAVAADHDFPSSVPRSAAPSPRAPFPDPKAEPYSSSELSLEKRLSAKARSFLGQHETALTAGGMTCCLPLMF